MSQETTTPQDRLVGNSLVDWALDGINGGEIADGMREVIDIHLAAQQVVESACGIAFRFDHLYTLSPAFQKLA